MASLTTMVAARIPDAMLRKAQEQYPETRELSSGQILRYALAVMLGEKDPMLFTQSAKFNVVRERIEP